MAGNEFHQRIEAIRRFNRFYTGRIGVLDESLLRSPFSLVQARILYELARRGETTAAAIGTGLGLDGGYLSRLLRGFEDHGLIARKPSRDDRRQSLLGLTEGGREAFAMLDSRARDAVGEMLDGLSPEDRDRLVGAMAAIEGILGPGPEPRMPYLLRPPRPGDMGWVVQRHGVLYAEEYGWDERFEAMVAGIVAEFIDNFDAKRERCWIAEMDGETVGSVFVVRHFETVAKLRMLLVEPKARGRGIGSRLVDECLRFARGAGYRKVTLWTNSVLEAARGIYEKAGFRRLARGPHHSFGQDLIGETWELEFPAVNAPGSAGGGGGGIPWSGSSAGRPARARRAAAARTGTRRPTAHSAGRPPPG